jgi:hypothetical protein
MSSRRLTQLGILIAALGWALLLFGGLLPRLFDLAAGRPGSAAIDVSRGDIAQMLIVSGFALALLGTLRAGVDTLRQFFDAVLQRAAAAKAQPAPPMSEPEPEPEYVDPDLVVERGRILNRPFARFADGSVEVETLLGVRRFASLADAQDFIGS